MKWSPQQEAGLRKILRWKSLQDSPYFILAGYAGTGKTTLASELIGMANKVVFMAFTGKAAHVLRKQGIEASTIHKQIYLPRDKCDSRFRHLLNQRKLIVASTNLSPSEKDFQLLKVDKSIAKERENLRRPDFTLNCESEIAEADLIVIDEYSMVSEQVGHDLLSFGRPILALGDPGQLPPVRGECFFKREPDVMLTEIHRQAEGNPIIHLSKVVREGGCLRPGMYGESRVVSARSLSDSAYNDAVLSSDQALVGLNKTRHDFNRVFRSKLQRTCPHPERGDKLVCLRNNHKVNLLNGQTWLVDHAGMSGDYLSLSLENPDDGDRLSCLAHMEPFMSPPREIDPSDIKSANHFEFGYALTVHKSQGSQWDHVVLLDEWRLKDRKQWLYTGITRASSKITIIQP